MPEEPLATTIRARIAELIEDDSPEDVVFVSRLIASFVDRSPAMLTNLATAVSARDALTAAHWAHALKGAAANLGVDNVAGLCAEVEDRAESAQLDMVCDHPALVAAELARAGRHLDEVIVSLGRA